MQRVTLELEGAVNGVFEVSAAEPLLFGRLPAARARLDDRRCSRLHCRIELGPRGLEIVDLGSRNGTWLDEAPIERAALPQRCCLRLGDSTIRIRIHPADDAGAALPSAPACERCGAPRRDDDTYVGPALSASDPGAGAAERLCAACAQREARDKAHLGHGLTRRLARLGFHDLQPLGNSAGALWRFVAQRRPIEQRVSLAFLPGRTLDAAERTRLYAAARLAHPAILRALDVIEDESGVWIVREHTPGCTLREELRRTGGRFAVGRLFALALPVAQALAHAHAHGVCHHALNPDAIWLGTSGEVKVLGFGSLALAGALSAACAYLAPEQREQGLAADRRADLYAFGALLYRALGGRRPPAMRGDQRVGRLLRALVEDVPEDVAGLIERCMAPLPTERFPCAQGVVAALEEAIRRYYGIASGEAALLARLGAELGPRPGAPDDETTRHVKSFRSNDDMTRFGGRFRGSELADLLQMLELNDKSGRIDVIDPAGGRAAITMRYGRVLEARYGARRGADAVRAVLALTEGHFGVVLGPVHAPGARGFAIGPLLLEQAVGGAQPPAERTPRTA